jgi:hypothetical protein
VTRLDLDARTTRPLRDLRLRSWAKSFDGSTWAVASDRSVLLLDVLREDLRTLWHVSDLPSTPDAIQRSPSLLAFMTFEVEQAAEGWVYSLPDPTLRRRDLITSNDDGATGLDLGGFSDGRWHEVVRPAAVGSAPLLRSAHPRGSNSYALDPAAESAELLGGEMLAVVTRTSDDACVRLLDPSLLASRASVTLGSCSALAVRIDGQRVTVADARGRVVGLDLSLGRVTHDLRI